VWVATQNKPSARGDCAKVATRNKTEVTVSRSFVWFALRMEKRSLPIVRGVCAKNASVNSLSRNWVRSIIVSLAFRMEKRCQPGTRGGCAEVASGMKTPSYIVRFAIVEGQDPMGCV